MGEFQSFNDMRQKDEKNRKCRLYITYIHNKLTIRPGDDFSK